MEIIDNIIDILGRHVKRHGVVPITNEDIMKVLNLAVMQKHAYEDDNDMSIVPWELYE